MGNSSARLLRRSLDRLAYPGAIVSWLTYSAGSLTGCRVSVLSRWCAWAVRSRLEPVKKVAASLRRHLDGVLRFVKHPITSGVAKGLNSKITSIKRKAGGFRNLSNFTTAIYFRCGGLDLYPR
jgi:transposase